MVTRTRWRRRATTGVVIAVGSTISAALASFLITPVVQGSPPPPHTLPPAAPRRKSVQIFIGETRKYWSSHKATVEETLAEARVKLGPKDEVFPDLDQPIWDGMPIFVCRVRTKLVARDQAVPYRTTLQPIQTRYRRLPIIQRRGRPGLRRRRIELVYRDGKLTEQRLVSERLLRDPVTELITLPPSYQLASRGYYGGRRVFRMEATAYDPGPGSCGASADGITAIGMRAGKGIAAVDPRVIPMKARLYIEGYGYAVAGDIGGAIKGHRIDLGFRSRAQAMQFGRRPVTVWVLD
jgi:3D (Asp-Asp-Asp) domain-containing protein